MPVVQKTDRIFYRDCEVFDVVIVGASLSALSLALKCVGEGARVALVYKEDTENPYELTIEDDSLTEFNASISAPARGCWGVGHYPSDFETVKDIIDSTFCFMREFPVLAEKMISPGVNYRVLKDSEIPLETVRQTFEKAKEYYRNQYEDDKNTCLREHLPHPDEFYYEVSPENIKSSISDAERENTAAEFWLNEGVLPIAEVYKQLASKAGPYLETGLITCFGGHTVYEVVSRNVGLTYVNAKNKHGVLKKIISLGPLFLNAWFYNNTLIRNTFVEDSDGVFSKIEPVKKTVRVKQLIRFFVERENVRFMQSTMSSRRCSLRSDGLLESTFVGYGLDQGLMVAILDNEVTMNGKTGYCGFATYAQLTNRKLIHDDGTDTVVQVEQEVGNREKTKELEGEIVANIESRLGVEHGTLKPLTSYVKTVVSGFVERGATIKDEMKEGGSFTRRPGYTVETVFNFDNRAVFAIYCMKLLGAARAVLDSLSKSFTHIKQAVKKRQNLIALARSRCPDGGIVEVNLNEFDVISLRGGREINRYGPNDVAVRPRESEELVAPSGESVEDICSDEGCEAQPQFPIPVGPDFQLCHHVCSVGSRVEGMTSRQDRCVQITPETPKLKTPSDKVRFFSELFPTTSTDTEGDGEHEGCVISEDSGSVSDEDRMIDFSQKIKSRMDAKRVNDSSHQLFKKKPKTACEYKQHTVNFSS